MDNTKEIAEQIFKFPIQPPIFYNLGVEDSQTKDIADKNHDLFIQNIIGSITLHGIEHLYGHRNVIELTSNQLDDIKAYTRSYGYELNILTTDNKIYVHFTPYKKK